MTEKLKVGKGGQFKAHPPPLVWKWVCRKVFTEEDKLMVH